jgi:hypothetical protein
MRVNLSQYHCGYRPYYDQITAPDVCREFFQEPRAHHKMAQLRLSYYCPATISHDATLL